jgi:hypothetical protein
VRQGEVEAVADLCGAGWSVVAVQLADGVLGGVGSSSAKRKQTGDCCWFRHFNEHVEGDVDKGSSLFGTYHRASGACARGYGQKAAAWAARCAIGRVLQEMITARRPASVT